jgi:hypothetical protein
MAGAQPLRITLLRLQVATSLFKHVAEQGHWSKLLGQAYNAYMVRFLSIHLVLIRISFVCLFVVVFEAHMRDVALQQRDLKQSTQTYLMLAESGYDVAQVNAAISLDQLLHSHNGSANFSTARLRRLWEHAFTQVCHSRTQYRSKGG